jgi:hypothetical protein
MLPTCWYPNMFTIGDGPIGTETCSLPFIKYKYDVLDENFYCFSNQTSKFAKLGLS